MIRRICWDSSVFIAWIMDEDRMPQERAGLAAAVDDIENRRAVMLASALVHAEVFAGNLTPDQRDRFDALFANPQIQLINVDRVIARRAGELRQACRAHGIRTPRTEDAVHLATAVVMGAAELHSFDEDLIGLGGRAPGLDLCTCKPRGRQTVLDLPDEDIGADG